jgi:hypothetical protein
LNLLLVGLNAKYIHSSLALYSLRSACHAVGHECEVVEYTINQEFLYILGDVGGRNPAAVGIVCYIWNREMVLKLTAALKQVLPEVVIIIGGPEASGDATALLLQNPSVDFVVQGEGEESVPELLTQLAQGTKMPNVDGIALSKEGVVKTNGGVRVVANLDCLPFAYRADMMPNLSNRIIYYESSRGCPFSCSYCVSSTTSGVRYRSIDLVKEELRFFIRHGVKQVKFVDRTFNVNPEYYREIWRFVNAEADSTNFHFEIVADLLSNEDIDWLATVAEGRFQFEIGVQSTCAETLFAIGRSNAWARLQENVQALLRGGNIHLHLDLIVGLPYENWRRFQQSFNAVYTLQPDMLQIGFLKLLPGTKICREAAEYGYVSLPHPPYEILANNFLSCHEVRQLKLIEEVFNQTYNSGRFVHTLSYLLTVFAGDAFAFYNELAIWWKQQGMAGKSHSPDGVLAMLMLFAARLFPKQQSRVKELLKFDALLDASRTLKGEQLDWNRTQWERQKSDCWRNEAIVRDYISEYHFTNWREVKRNYPIEIFAQDVPHWLISGEWSGREYTPVIFAAGNNRVTWHVLEPEALSLEGNK